MVVVVCWGAYLLYFGELYYTFPKTPFYVCVAREVESVRLKLWELLEAEEHD